jgi:hypothetical protein
MQDIDIGSTLYELGGNVEAVGRQLRRRRRDYSLQELESLRQVLMTNAKTIESLINIQKREMGISTVA